MDITQYKDVYVFAEQRGGVVQKVAFELLGKARELADALNEKVVAVLLGKDIENKAQDLIQAGADKVLVVDNDALKNYMTEPYTQALSQIINERKPDILLLGATTIGRDLGPRVSARVTTGLTADCTKLEIGENGEFLMTRPAFGGNLMATILCKDHRPQMATVRPGVMQRLEDTSARKGEVEKVEVSFNMEKINRVKLLESVVKPKTTKDITEAPVLVSAGRGVHKEYYGHLRELADELNGEVSASRATVDAGNMDHDLQVGQTGKTVRPQLYVACAISGAIQHLAGMEESEYIIAINKDKFAPIFGVADIGIVGEVEKIVPLLTEKIRNLKK